MQAPLSLNDDYPFRRSLSTAAAESFLDTLDDTAAAESFLDTLQDLCVLHACALDLCVPRLSSNQHQECVCSRF